MGSKQGRRKRALRTTVAITISITASLLLGRSASTRCCSGKGTQNDFVEMVMVLRPCIAINGLDDSEFVIVFENRGPSILRSKFKNFYGVAQIFPNC